MSRLIAHVPAVLTHFLSVFQRIHGPPRRFVSVTWFRLLYCQSLSDAIDESGYGHVVWPGADPVGQQPKADKGSKQPGQQAQYESHVIPLHPLTAFPIRAA
jgi:hypothetical protein